MIKKILKVILGKILILQKVVYRKASYAQSGEDLIVKFVFNSLGIKKPSYLDIGAHQPYYISNTALLYQNGSRGVNIEPDPNLFTGINRARRKDINLNCGVGKREGVMDFYVVNASTLNTFSKEEAESYSEQGDYKVVKTIPVLVKTLDSILNEHLNGKFPDFLSLDVEGMDEEIIKSIDYESSRPIVICVETISFSNSGNGVKNNSIVDFLEGKGYMVYADTNINTIFVREDKWRCR
jgi:FkbM family methyltransferase